MNFSSYTATAAFALMGAFSQAAESGPDRQPSPEVVRATQMREDSDMAQPNTLANAMVSRPVELWNANMKDALCKTNPAMLMPRVGAIIQQERREAAVHVENAFTGRLNDKVAVMKSVGFAYADILALAQERKIDYAQAKYMVDTAATAKLRNIRQVVSGLTCP